MGRLLHLLALFLLVGVISKTASQSCVTPNYPADIVLDTPRKSLIAWSLDTIQSEEYANAILENGVVVYCMALAGWPLAVLHEAPYCIQNRRFGHLLRIGCDENVAPYWHDILVQAASNRDINVTSTFFTKQNTPFTSPPGFATIFTTQQYFDFASPTAAQQLNDHVALHTNSIIENLLVPNEPFPAATEAVLIQTFIYKAEWNKSFTEIHPPQQFTAQNGDQHHVTAMETVADVEVCKTKHWTAVSIPMKDHYRIVFVIPETNLDHFLLHHVEELYSTDTNLWPKKNIRVQLPKFNTTVARNFPQWDKSTGFAVQCTPGNSNCGADKYIVHPLVEVASFNIEEEAYMITVAAGTQIDKTTQASTNNQNYGQKCAPAFREAVCDPDPDITDFVVNRPYYELCFDPRNGAKMSLSSISVDSVVNNPSSQQPITSDFNFSPAKISERWNCPVEQLI